MEGDPKNITMGDREENLKKRFENGELTMDEFLGVREQAYGSSLSEDERKFYHDLTNQLMMVYEERRSALSTLIDVEVEKHETQEHFNSDLRAINPYYLEPRELDLFKLWQKKKLTIGDLPDPEQMQHIYDTAGDAKDSKKHFYSWLRNEIQVAQFK
jgi:hypothetical protein